MEMAGIRRFSVVVLLTLVCATSYGQITTGTILFERKTNLKKQLGDNPRAKQFITEENKIRIEQFELHFNDSMAAFLPVESDEEEAGMMKYFTTRNSVYQDLSKDEKMTVMDLWGNETYLKGEMSGRSWKVTESKRKIGGYLCRKAIWEMNDSTRIYAWFSVDIVPPVGPEGFSGLPGTILGLATENGGVIYFAKSVSLIAPKPELLTTDPGKKDVYTKPELRELLEEKMGKWMKKSDFDGMFSWL